ncbi:mobile element protein [Acetivibrio straminisolvens JCM 21531]|uniref:Mobile element protein n=1 Tax=Acetivibrio straminisolvens JCM 21531 TaxID=1294263 RepID=W4VCL1_9FIRM|nr:transposase [Clostridium sp. Bc-iso-3]GAE90906.1 mobile element protein [Acetivibrio straminisolvens JCM 21531]
MNYTQNEKILRIKETTLIFGIDIGSEKHYARAFNFRGVEYGKLLIFYNNAKGIAKFEEWTAKIAKSNGFTEVILGMEPTGHYWFNLAENTKKTGMSIVLVNPHYVKKSKELDANNPTKNDRKDPKSIAMLVKDGRYIELYILEGIYKELRLAMDSRWRLVKELSAIRNRISRWICIHYPEITKVFDAWEGKAALLILSE